jgi:hypothetical protein
MPRVEAVKRPAPLASDFSCSPALQRAGAARAPLAGEFRTTIRAVSTQLNGI